MVEANNQSVEFVKILQREYLELLDKISKLVEEEAP